MKSILTVVTIVKDDLDGLLRTRQSLKPCRDFIDWLIVTPNESGLTLQLAQQMLAEREIERIVFDNGFGIYQAMNLALASIDGDQWVWFLNSGDEVAESSTLDVIWKTLNNSSADWIYGGFYLADRDGEIIRYHAPPQCFEPRKQLFSRSFVSHQSIIMKSSLLNSLHGFDEEIKVAADWDLLVRASQISKPNRVDHPIAIFHLGGFSSSNRHIGNRDLLKLRTKYLSKSFIPLSYLWFLHRIFRNKIVNLLERINPKFIKFLRRAKSRLLKN